MPSAPPNASLSNTWRGKGVVRASLLLVAAAAIAALAANFGIARDYGYLRASILTGTPGGQYHALAMRLSERAKRQRGKLSVIATAGSVENVNRLVANQRDCKEMFAIIQDGTPVADDAGLELLGRLPQPESLLLLAKKGRGLRGFGDLHGASVGVGPEGSGTAHLMRHLFEDADLRGLNVRLSNHEWSEQAALVVQGKLDIAAYVMQEDAEFLHQTLRKHDLDIVSLNNLQGLLARYPWLSLGQIPAGRYDLVQPVPAVDTQIARLSTFVVANRCTPRADRVAVLMLLGAEIVGFVRANPPGATSAATRLRLAPEAHQFFLTGEAEIGDRYFPWLANLMSPAYWVYLVMAVTILFNGMRAFSRFRLWRLDATREKIEADLKDLVGAKLTHAQMRAVAPDRVLATVEKRSMARDLRERLTALRARCQRYANSLVTPMGDELYYRYQQSLIDEATTTVGDLLATQAGSPPSR